MWSRKKRSIFMLMLTAALSILLSGLAILQYNWLSQSSNAELARTQANINLSAMRFSEEFNKQLIKLPLMFEDIFDFSHRDLKEIYRSCSAKVFAGQTNIDKRWVKDIFIAEFATNDKFKPLLKFNPQTGKFETTQWPDEFQNWQKRMESGSDKDRLLECRPTLNEELESLVLQIHTKEEVYDGKIIPVPGMVIVRLNYHIFTQEMLPILAQRYFSNGNSKIKYNLLITSNRYPDRVIYQSNPSSTVVNFGKADTTANLFALYSDRITGVNDNEINGLADIEKISPVQLTRGRWLLQVKHPAGSLAQAVEQTRQRNLLISFSVLLLFAISIATIIWTTQRMQLLAKQQMDFIAGISHELRTPLAVIRSASENMIDGVITNSQEAREYGQLIKDEEHRLSEMVEQVLKFAGIQRGREGYQLQAIDVESVIEGAIADVQAILQKEGFKLIRDISTPLPLVMADHEALQCAVRNLLANAIKYSRDIREIELNVNSNERELSITIADQGLGIAPDDLLHIFEPFYRGQSNTEEKIHGSGLGLAIVQNIITAHKGNLQVESQLGQGSLFKISLPVVSKSEREQSYIGGRYA